MPAIDDLRAYLERQRKAIERSEPGVRDGADPEDLHRFRVATRRSRAMIRASRPLVHEQLAALDRDLRWLGRKTGPVRDLDVMIDHLGQLQPGLDPDQAGAAAIVSALERERIHEREALVEAIDTSRYRELLARFAISVDDLTVSSPDVSLEHLAEQEVERVREGYGELGDDPADDELHALRIHAKHARYAAELAAMAAGDQFQRLADALTEIQDLIGAHQDAVVAEQCVRALADEDARLAAGRIVELERARKREARAELPAAMEALERCAEEAFAD